MGPAQRQERQRGLLLPGGKRHSLVHRRPFPVRGQHFQHHAHRPDRGRLRDGYRGLQLQSHRRLGAGVLRGLPASAVLEVKDFHHSGIPGKAVRQPVAVLFLGHQHHRQHLSGRCRCAVFGGFDSQAPVPVGGTVGVRGDLCRHRGILHHPGRPFGGHQHGPHPGAGAPGGFHRDDDYLLRQGRRSLFRGPDGERRHRRPAHPSAH